jgi:hypothetical protein
LAPLPFGRDTDADDWNEEYCRPTSEFAFVGLILPPTTMLVFRGDLAKLAISNYRDHGAFSNCGVVQVYRKGEGATQVHVRRTPLGWIWRAQKHLLRRFGQKQMCHHIVSIASVPENRMSDKKIVVEPNAVLSDKTIAGEWF